MFHFFAVLYGAALTEKMEETYLFSLLMSSLSVLPIVLLSEEKWWNILQIPNFLSYLDSTTISQVKLISLLAIIGAICGSFTLALDWNRAWKVWPVPCCIGGVAGYTAGLTLFTVVASLEYLKSMFGKKRTKFY